MIGSRETKYIFNLTFRRNDIDLSVPLASYLILHTNSTNFKIPLHVCHGRLQVKRIIHSVFLMHENRVADHYSLAGRQWVIVRMAIFLSKGRCG